MQINLISHVYNEEYLLPTWIKHHRKMFPKAIIIDYNSTDETQNIFANLAPREWKLVQSRNLDFGAAACDEEVMEIERSLKGWKIALNATEFLVFPRMGKTIDLLNAEGVEGVRVSGYAMVDPSDMSDKAKQLRSPIWKNLHFGVPEYKLPIAYEHQPDQLKRPIGRLLHNYVDGGYSVGRHSWRQDGGELPRSIASVFWYGFSPWNRGLVGRKIQIGSQIPPLDKEAGLGSHHLLHMEGLERLRNAYLEKSFDLKTLKEFRKVTKRWRFLPTTLPELHTNALPFGHHFGPADLIKYINGHFGIESNTLNEAWWELGRLKKFERDQKDTPSL